MIFWRSGIILVDDKYWAMCNETRLVSGDYVDFDCKLSVVIGAATRVLNGHNLGRVYNEVFENVLCVML